MKYDIIYADPPWDYKGQTQFMNEKVTSAADMHYNHLSLQDLKNLNIKEISADNCPLFMWTSSPHLDQAIDLLKSWGFAYATIAFVWDKQAINPGYYTLSQCEICIVGKKGTIPQPRGARNIRQFLSEKRGEHSAKPTEIRNRIAQMFPTQNKIELFARTQQEGWHVWDNEAPNPVAIDLQGEVHE